jgi:hypothetical protein
MAGVARAIVSPLSIIDKGLGKAVLQITAVVAPFIPGGAPFAAIAAIALATLYKPKGPKAEQAERAIKMALPPRVSAYGRVKLYGAYILFVTSKDGYAIDVYAFHDGRIDGIERYYLGDKQVMLDGSGFVLPDAEKAYGNGNIEIGVNLGLPTETAFASLIAKLPGDWTAQHRGDGVVTGFQISKPVKVKNFSEVYPQGGPDATPLGIVFRAQCVFDWRDPSQSVTDPSTWRWSENNALHVAHYLLVRVGKDWDTHFAPTLAYWTAFADDCDVLMPLKGIQTITTGGGQQGNGFVDTPTAAGLAAGMQVVITASDNTSHSETRTVTSVSYIVGGGTATIAFSGGLAYDHPIGSRVSWASSPSAPATEPRYRSCVSHKHTDQHKTVLGNLLACCDGFVAPRSDGALMAFSGRFVTPTVDVGPDIIVNYSWDEGVVDEDAINEVAVSYLSADHDYTTVDATAWSDEDAIEAAGEIKPTQLDNQVPSHAQARRLAKRLLSKTMALHRGSVTTNRYGRMVRGHRFINLHIEEAGAVFFSGFAEITQLTRNLSTGGVTFTWIEADPNVDAWNPATEEGDPAPVGNVVAGEPLDTPAIISATAMYSAVGSTPEGDEPIDPTPGQTATGARVLIAANGPDRADLTWYARWRVGTSGSWNEREYADADPGPGVSFQTEFVPLASNLNVEVAYSVGDGRLSDWSDPVVVNTTTG